MNNHDEAVEAARKEYHFAKLDGHGSDQCIKRAISTYLSTYGAGDKLVERLREDALSRQNGLGLPEGPAIEEQVAQDITTLRAQVAELEESLHLANGVADLAMKHRDAAEAENVKLREAILWACGFIDEFPVRQPGQGAYWWRSELLRRAGHPWDSAALNTPQQPTEESGT